MYICIILLLFQKKITVGAKLHAICLPRGPTFNDININMLVKSIYYLRANRYAFRFGGSSTVFHKLWSVGVLKYYHDVRIRWPYVHSRLWTAEVYRAIGFCGEDLNISHLQKDKYVERRIFSKNFHPRS